MIDASSMRALDKVGPELAEAINATSSRAPNRCIADEKIAAEYLGLGLKQGIESTAPASSGRSSVSSAARRANTFIFAGR
jgi:hypothetical protein